MPRGRPPHPRTEEIASLLAQGLRYEEIAKATGCGLATISAIAQTIGHERRTSPHRERARALRGEGMSYQAIAAQIEHETDQRLSWQRIQRFCRGTGPEEGRMDPSYMISADEQALLRGQHVVVGHYPASDEHHAPRAICACGAVGVECESALGGSAPESLPACVVAADAERAPPRYPQD